MAIPFPDPDPSFEIDVAKAKRELNAHFKLRGVPRSDRQHLLVASWNVANLGAQTRKKDALEVIAHLARRFDLLALQEVNADFHDFDAMVELMRRGYAAVMTDTAGNAERLAFVYRKSRVKLGELFGELALRPGEYPKHTVKVEYRQRGVNKVDVFRNHKFVPFDRNPFIGSFRSDGLSFTLVNVHLYFGAFGDSTNKTNRTKYARRVLEIYALSRWSDRRVDRPDTTYDTDIVLMGDMNVPVMKKSNAAYRALTKFGFQPIDYLDQGKVGGSNIADTKTYDQVAFAPGAFGKKTVAKGVFDFDNGLFKARWKQEIDAAMGDRTRAARSFNKLVKHRISDHRPVWFQVEL